MGDSGRFKRFQKRSRGFHRLSLELHGSFRGFRGVSRRFEAVQAISEVFREVFGTFAGSESACQGILEGFRGILEDYAGSQVSFRRMAEAFQTVSEGLQDFPD